MSRPANARNGETTGRHDLATTEAPLRPRRVSDRFVDALLGVAGLALERIERIQVKRGHKIRGRMVFTVNIEEDKLDGGYIAECSELPGCMSQGETEEEALKNIVDAITGVLEAKMQKHLQDMAFEFSHVEAETKQVPDNGDKPSRTRAVEIPVA
jgi:predicted RNase H-like HicB family nuclease